MSTDQARKWTDAAVACAANGWYLAADRVRLARGRRSAPRRLEQRVSIPIATYDRIDILVDRTIPFLTAQTHQDLEIIVVGDGTPEDLWKRVEELEDPRIRSRRLPSRTRYPDDPLSLWMVAGWRARNVGAQMATGDWIFWMSDDDIIPERAIEALLDVARRDPAVELVTGEHQVGLDRRLRTNLENTDHMLPVRAIGMPLLCRSSLAAFRWNRHSWRKSWNRPCDVDLLERMGRAGVRMDVTDELVAIQTEVSDTGLIGSRGAIAEELRRRARGGAQPS